MDGWIKEVIIKRYDELSEKVECIDELKTLTDQVAAYENILFESVAPGTHEVLKQWMELHGEMASLQKQWLYIKGVQDGLQLMVFLERSAR